MKESELMKPLKRYAIDAPDELLLEISKQDEFEEWVVPTLAPTGYLSHGYFRYIGKFPPQIVHKVILDYGRPGGTLLDPMCGGGTSLIEAGLHKMSAIGLDINPVSRLISRVCTTVIDPDYLNQTYQDVNDLLSRQEMERIPLFSQKSKNGRQRSIRDLKGMEHYFDDIALQQLIEVQEYIDGLSNEAVRSFFQLALLATLRKVSRANVKKMNTEIDEDKKVLPVGVTLRKKMLQMMEGNKSLAKLEFPSSAITVQEGIAENTKVTDPVDLVILHPPYLSGTAFSESVQLQLAWLGMKHKDLIPKELAMRGSYFHKANGLRKYLVGWSQILSEAYRSLVPGGVCVAVVGDGRVDGVRIPMGPITREFGKDHGFEMEKWAKHLLHHNTGRTLNRRMVHQDIIVFRKALND
jgi:DNA modification methylase